MVGKRAALGTLAAAVLAVGLVGCAETKLVSTTVKSLEKPEATPGYKIGKPYQVNGVWYYPAEDFNYSETGIASWYGDEFAGRPTANGEIFRPSEISAAHRTLPMPSIVRVTNLENGRALAVRINDRGPFAHGRIIDLSRRAAQLLGFYAAGTARVRVEILEEESRAVAVATGRLDAGASTPQAAPVGTVVAEALPGSALPPGAQTKPVPVSAVGRADAASSLDGRVWQMPVRPTQLYVQAGAFTSYENARQLGAKLASLGPARVTPAQIGSQRFYRVRLGPIASVEQADFVLSRVILVGHPEARIVVD
ncbi:MAG TPA: septal ring lytic transglycosylase RlpA family protein [Alphaproteobacteria bacterium]|nr:septal ring lytic transglycosylase RlpA family protein [Alphaproteobacteria bacterium]